MVKRGVWDDADSTGMLRFSGACGDGPVWHRVEQNLRSRAYRPGDVVGWLSAAGLEVQALSVEIPPCPCGAERASECRTVYRAVKAA